MSPCELNIIASRQDQIRASSMPDLFFRHRRDFTPSLGVLREALEAIGQFRAA
jgi:hypothetical protein